MHLRTRLFLSFGVVILFISLLSYFLPNYLVRQDIKQAGAQLKELVHSNENHAFKTESVFAILNQMQVAIFQKISWNLFAASGVGFLLAIFLLSRISKKVTGPIVTLAAATRQLEEGRYEDIHFPASTQSGDEVGTLIHGFERMVHALKERETIRGVLNKVVSKEVATEILNGKIELGGEERVATILFSDLRNFTHLTENIPPTQLIGLMNRYFTEMCRIIDENKGIVDKFVGDEVMALYGVPLQNPEHPLCAIKTALAMVESLKTTNLQRVAKGLPKVEMGIGIHTGRVVAGNVGSENRLNYTVLGAHVNLSSRLCSIAKGMQIVVSEATWNLVKDCVMGEELPAVSLKGISHPVRIFQIHSL